MLAISSPLVIPWMATFARIMSSYLKTRQLFQFPTLLYQFDTSLPQERKLDAGVENGPQGNGYV